MKLASCFSFNDVGSWGRIEAKSYWDSYKVQGGCAKQWRETFGTNLETISNILYQALQAAKEKEGRFLLEK